MASIEASRKGCCRKCEDTCLVGKLEPEIAKKLDDAFEKLAKSKSKSLLKKHLTPEIYDKIKNLKTSFGSTLLDCAQSGFENHDSGVGIYAPDPEAYKVFGELFDPIIEEYHIGFGKQDKHPMLNFGNPSCIGNVDPKGEFVISTRVRCGRSVQGFPFNPCMKEEDYLKIEEQLVNAFKSLEGELAGQYYPLKGMTKMTQQKLIDDHFLFKEGDRFLQSANACRFWPTGRGIFHNNDKTFLVWVNEEDHIRIISLQQGGDLGATYKRFVDGVEALEKCVNFVRCEHLGYLSFCPTNLGTSIRASVHIQVPKLASDMETLEGLAAKYNLQVRGTRGEHTESEGGVYDISNKRRLGLCEFEAIKEMNNGIMEIIKEEKNLQEK